MRSPYTPTTSSSSFIFVSVKIPLKSLPAPVDGVLIVVPPAQTEQVVREAAEAGIHRVWMQPGADSAFYHQAHKFVWGVLGKLPR